MTQTTQFLAPLPDLAVLRISGADAATFLHSQLSNDITGIGPGDARLAAYCNPKGRMLGSMILWKETESTDSAFLALAKADVVETMLKRLRMFVLRAKVVFEATPLHAHGLCVVHAANESGTLPWRVERSADMTLISAPSASPDIARRWVVGRPEQGSEALAEYFDVSQAPASAWQAQDIQAALGWIEQGNVELFIPQSLAYDLTGGVSFSKGCYPGQEVVARAHYRGTVKRRVVPARCYLGVEFALNAGDDIFDAGRPNSPAGRVVNAACMAAGDGQAAEWYLLMEISLTDMDQADFRALSPEGPAISLLPVPYPLEAAQ